MSSGTRQASEPSPARDTPEASVVIPTHRRETRLAFALDALAQQTVDPDRFEVLVVRAADAKGPFTEPPDGLRVRVLTHPGEGRPAAQRNLGWRSAEAPLVAFTDDDCRPAPDWLARLLDAQEGPDALLQGRTEPDPDERHLLHGNARSMEVIEPDDWYPTCNIAYPRDLLERLGGFDESYEHAWGEDTDLGLRAVESGARHVYVDEALVWHAVLPRPLRAVLREAVQRDRIALMAHHPSQRENLYLGLFLNRNHARFALAIAGVAIVRRSPLAGTALIAPYLTKNVNRRNLAPRALPRTVLRATYHLPRRVLVDSVEMAVTVRSAVRHRFPAL
jgi:GT2 family glycosyltransferase